MNKSLFGTILVIFFLTIFQPICAKETRIVKVGSDNHYPVLFKDTDGSARGLYVDLLAEIGRKENIKFEYVFDSWQNILNLIKTGKIDLLPGVGYSKERSEYMDYCQYPLLTVWGELYTLPSNDIKSIFNISGKKIGVIQNDINTDKFHELTKQFGIRCDFIELDGFEEIFKAIADKEIDAGVAGITFGASKQKEYGLISTGIIFNPYDLFISTPKDKNSDLRLLIDSYIYEWSQKDISILSQAKNRWFYGSVGTVEILPKWLMNLLIVLGIIMVASFIFILLLKLQIKKATQTLRESETHYRTLSDSGQALIWTSGLDKKCNYFNQTWLHFTGRSLEQELGDGWIEGVHPDDLQKCIDTYVHAFDRREKFSMNYRIRHVTNEYRWIQDDGTPRFSSTGEFLGYIGHCLDITENVLAHEKIQNLLSEKELLLREVHHRIKNNMNTIKGLLTLQISAEKNPSTAASLRDAESRVQSMILLYERLYCTDNYREIPVKEYLQKLTYEIIGGYPNNENYTINFEIEDFILNINMLTPLGIIINELITNMMKYAFVGKKSGKIYVSAFRKNNEVSVVVQDNGVGMPDSISFEKSTGFGMQLIGMLTEQIGGTIQIVREAGTKVLLHFTV